MLPLSHNGPSSCPVGDRYDILINYAAQWPQYWLIPLLSKENFNDHATLIVLSLDKNESYTETTVS